MKNEKRKIQIPCSVPNHRKKWRIIREKLAPHKNHIDQIIKIKERLLFDSGFGTGRELHDLVRIGYALALEDNGLKEW